MLPGATLKNDLHSVAERMEKELGEERESFLPRTVSSGAEDLPIAPGKPAFTLGLDGAYVHAGGRAGWLAQRQRSCEKLL